MLLPFPFVTKKLNVIVEPTQTGVPVTVGVPIVCALTPPPKNERRNKEISEAKILRNGKPMAVSRFIFWGAVVFLEV